MDTDRKYEEDDFPVITASAHASSVAPIVQLLDFITMPFPIYKIQSSQFKNELFSEKKVNMKSVILSSLVSLLVILPILIF